MQARPRKRVSPKRTPRTYSFEKEAYKLIDNIQQKMAKASPNLDDIRAKLAARHRRQSDLSIQPCPTQTGPAIPPAPARPRQSQGQLLSPVTHLDNLTRLQSKIQVVLEAASKWE